LRDLYTRAAHLLCRGPQFASAGAYCEVPMPACEAADNRARGRRFDRIAHLASVDIGLPKVRNHNWKRRAPRPCFVEGGELNHVRDQLPPELRGLWYLSVAEPVPNVFVHLVPVQ